MTQQYFEKALTQSHLWFSVRANKAYIVDCRDRKDCHMCIFNIDAAHCTIQNDDILTAEQLTWLQTHHPEHLI